MISSSEDGGDANDDEDDDMICLCMFCRLGWLEHVKKEFNRVMFYVVCSSVECSGWIKMNGTKMEKSKFRFLFLFCLGVEWIGLDCF